LIACQPAPSQSSADNLPKQKPISHNKKSSSLVGDVKGSITEIKPMGKNLQITVEELPGKSMEGSKGHLTITPHTNIRYAHLQTFAPVTMDELKLNQWVTAKCTGSHTMIFPIQCEVGELVIE
jgi:hypothetical protein